jgi:hypothetical protein
VRAGCADVAYGTLATTEEFDQLYKFLLEYVTTMST